jgi:hypothetical protein
MTKAYDYGADKVWLLNVGDLKPAELDIEFFLKLAWHPHSWNGTNTYDLLQKQIARDFGNEAAPEITSIMAEYYRLNFQRKPEHIGWPTNLFSANEARQRLADWERLVSRTDAVKTDLPPQFGGAFFELVEYPVKAAALENEKFLAPEKAQSAQNEIQRLTDIYNNQTAGGKWHLMMSDDPRGQMDLQPAQIVPAENNLRSANPENSGTNPDLARANASGADFTEQNHRVVMQADHASDFVPGKDARWQKITGLGYNGEAVSTFPTTVAIRDTPDKIPAESPCLQYKIYFQDAGGWTFTVRALPTFSVETGQPQRYAIALDDEPPKIVSLPLSQDERNRTWQENVLRNAALTSSVHSFAQPGLHTLKIWMVDPGIVLDAIEAETAGAPESGYVWPPETRVKK